MSKKRTFEEKEHLLIMIFCGAWFIVSLTIFSTPFQGNWLATVSESIAVALAFTFGILMWSQTNERHTVAGLKKAIFWLYVAIILVWLVWVPYIAGLLIQNRLEPMTLAGCFMLCISSTVIMLYRISQTKNTLLIAKELHDRETIGKEDNG